MLVVALVESPLKFVKVCVHVLGADLMIRTNDRPLEQRPYALNRVRVDIAAYPFLRAMVDRLMRRVGVGYSNVTRSLIGYQALSICRSGFEHEVMQRVFSGLLAFV